MSTHQIWPPNFSYFCQICSSGKICLERSNFKFHFWPPNFKFDLLPKNMITSPSYKKNTISKIYLAWTQKSNLMLNLGQILAKFYLVKFAQAGSNLAKINLMRGHSIVLFVWNEFASTYFVYHIEFFLVGVSSPFFFSRERQFLLLATNCPPFVLIWVENVLSGTQLSNLLQLEVFAVESIECGFR